MAKPTKRKKAMSKIDEPYKQLHLAVSEINTEEYKKHEQGRTISVSALPACPHKELLEKMVLNPKTASIVVVALRDLHDNKWRAYAGFPDKRDLRPVVNVDFDADWYCDNIRDRSGVLIMGTKLAPEILPLIFADMKAEECK